MSPPVLSSTHGGKRRDKYGRVIVNSNIILGLTKVSLTVPVGVPRSSRLGDVCDAKAARDIDVVISKRGLAMTPKSSISRLGAGLIALALIVAPPASIVHAVGDAHKVSVVSFGLFGDQGVFRSEATGAAQVVAGRFGGGPINVQYNSKKGGGATIQGLAMALQAAANGMDAENDVLFLILTSHGSRAGLAVKAGRLTQLLTPLNLGDMLALTGVRHKVLVISACYSGVLSLVSRTPMCW